MLGRSSPRRQRGVGLVEWLVALVIATLGLLALAGLQASAVRHAKLSQYRAIATQLANDIVERVRANRPGNAAGSAAAYAFRQKFADQLDGQPQAPALPAKACDSASATSPCTEADMAAADLASWRVAVRALLPQGAVYLDPDADRPGAAAAGSPAFDLWLAWSDPAQVPGGQRPGNECPSGLALDASPQVRCLFLRVMP